MHYTEIMALLQGLKKCILLQVLELDYNKFNEPVIYQYSNTRTQWN